MIVQMVTYGTETLRMNEEIRERDGLEIIDFSEYVRSD